MEKFQGKDMEESEATINDMLFKSMNRLREGPTERALDEAANLFFKAWKSNRCPPSRLTVLGLEIIKACEATAEKALPQERRKQIESALYELVNNMPFSRFKKE